MPPLTAAAPITRSGATTFRRRALALTCSLAALAVAAACGSGGAADIAESGDDTAGITVENCAATVELDAPPERVVMLKSASTPYLAELGVLDRVVARAGSYPRDYYSDDTWQEVEQIPLLTDRLDSAGHLQISRETVLAKEPDLVLGEVDNLDRDTLAASGIPLIEEPTLCDNHTGEPGFSDVSDQLRLYGKVFGVPERAEEAVERVENRLTQITAKVDKGEDRTVAVLYPSVGDGPTYAYGTGSMTHAVVEAAGFSNVFSDNSSRVFEVSREELIGRNPDVLVLLYSDGEPAAVEDAVAAIPGIKDVTAVREDAVVTLLFNFGEPPSPLSLDGLDRIVTGLAR